MLCSENISCMYYEIYRLSQGCSGTAKYCEKFKFLEKDRKRRCSEGEGEKERGGWIQKGQQERVFHVFHRQKLVTLRVSLVILLGEFLKIRAGLSGGSTRSVLCYSRWKTVSCDRLRVLAVHLGVEDSNRTRVSIVSERLTIDSTFDPPFKLKSHRDLDRLITHRIDQKICALCGFYSDKREIESALLSI